MKLQRLADLIELGRKFVKENFGTYLSNYNGVLQGCPMGMAYVGQMVEQESWTPDSAPSAELVMERFRDDRHKSNYGSYDGSFMIADKLGLDRVVALSISLYHASGRKTIEQILEALRANNLPIPLGKEEAIRTMVDEATSLGLPC